MTRHRINCEELFCLPSFRLERMQYSRVVTCAHCDLWWDVVNIWWKVCTAIHEGSPSFNVSQTISIQGIGMHIAAFLVSHDAHDQWKDDSTPSWLREAIIMTDNMRWKHGCWMKCVNPRETRGEYIDRSNAEEVYYDHRDNMWYDPDFVVGTMRDEKWCLEGNIFV